MCALCRPDDFEATVDTRLSPEMAERLDKAASQTLGRTNYVARNARQRTSGPRR